MESYKIAIVDLGSNTFHLIIAEVDISDGHGFTIIHKHRNYVKLASKGKSFIDKHSYWRGMEAMIQYANTIKEYKVQHVKAIGTAMLRKASNSKDFIEDVFDQTGIKIQVVDGEKEAQLIGLGVKECIPVERLKKAVILDIGGGSIEFILLKNAQIDSLHSFPIGIAILKNRFHSEEPISASELVDLFHFLKKTLEPVLSEIRKDQFNCLIGCSGTFEVLVDSLTLSQHSWSEIDIDATLTIIQKIQTMDLKDRIEHPGIPEERADLIVVATGLIEFLLRELNFNCLLYSPYALKEGAIADYIQTSMLSG